MYFSNQPKEFRNIILKELGFQPTKKKNYILYENKFHPEYGFYRLYERTGFYDFGVADYTIPQGFEIQFNNSNPILRLGIVYDGITSYQLEKQPVSSFMPSTFLVFEKGICGKQLWKKGQHFYGAEITIYPAFFEELSNRFSNFSIFNYFIENQTYYYLPSDILPIVSRMIHLDQTDSLNALHLEAAVLECMGAIKETETPDGQNGFSRQINYGSVTIGKKKKLNFTEEDFKSIQKAHDILTEQFIHPPTIEALSRQLLINSQKLKAGFSYYYHMTIGEYTASLKMSLAAVLLCTTEKSVAEIAHEVGYDYSASFIKKFQKTYSCTPLKYRMREKKPPYKSQ
ncbi:helix-turn-helix transcriptional regulator [Velocimicrobium porci]|uniref:Helix-turn-helix transcriptional regulator n=1 Tax=Velocimicrobium porci TaxID=2606634 RepID=A0A6L5Y1D0_9FIRM|nr:AraC family transcriptional regulator [Velocimicrobium porci]MSS64724.1 helix-turn-helix transcriptional regulator [Velocimicrobium porci]